METLPSGRPPLLFLCHRIPYPPNKGDKIRSFHLLHHLSQHFDIHLACFIDDPTDKSWTNEVEKFCRSSLFVELKPFSARLKSLAGLLSGEALSVPYYRSTTMREWVENSVRRYGIRHAIVYSSPMAQFVYPVLDRLERSIVDFVDVDSDKWQQYADTQPWPMKWLLRREARRLLEYEERLAQDFDAGLFVSSSEADLFRRLAPSVADKVGYYNNGVNTEYFDPGKALPNPYPAGIQPLVFTGAMDYWPNVDAVTWFCAEILPRARAMIPGLHLYIVGSNPTRAVQNLAIETGVVVTGKVDDIRPYILHSSAAVAPMRVARGVQNKVLEAMAMEKFVLVSDKGHEGIEAVHAEHLVIANTPEDYLNWIQRVYSEPGLESIGKRARVFVEANFNWDNNLPEVVILLGEGNGRSTDGVRTASG